MASEKLTDRTLFAGTLSGSDLIHIVDVSDTTDSAAGSSFKLTLTQLKTFVRDNIYIADGTLSGNRVVTQAGFYISYQGGAAGFGNVPDSDTRVHIQGTGATSATFAMKVKGSASAALLYVRDDGRVGVNTDDLQSPLSIKCDSGNRGLQIAHESSGVYRVHVYSNNGSGSEEGQVNLSSPSSDYRFWTGSITGHTTSTNHLFTIHANGRVSVTRDKADPNYGGWNFYINANGNSDRGIWVKATGAGTTTYAGYFESITGGATNKIGIYATASGGTNNYAAIFGSGLVGIGETTPTSKVHIKTTTTDGTVGVLVKNSGGTTIMELTNDGTLNIPAKNILTGGFIKTGDPGGVAGAWKFGTVQAAAVALDTANYVEVSIGGSAYKIALVN